MRTVVAVVVVAIAVASCSEADDTADPTGAATSTTVAAPQASIELRPVTQQGLPCDDLPAELDPATVLRHEDIDLACSQVGPGAVIDLARAETKQGGATGEEWVVEVEVADDDRARANELFNACASAATSCPGPIEGQLAIVVDDVIVSAPTVNEPNLADDAFIISGGGAAGFTRDEADALVERIQR